jgi:hypothetical protein
VTVFEDSYPPNIYTKSNPPTNSSGNIELSPRKINNLDKLKIVTGRTVHSSFPETKFHTVATLRKTQTHTPEAVIIS